MKFTPEDYQQWFQRRFGATNPERMQNPFHEWMVRSGADPYHVRDQIGVSHAFHHQDPSGEWIAPDPCWCFARYGMSRTPMTDGRIICIAGEHEDSYDPDFCIYNDVIVLRPGPGEPSVTETSGEVEIYGYPESVFPPTDFHSATLVGERIYIIGRLGYKESRNVPSTPVFALNTRTYEIEAVRTSGPSPGLIYTHFAWYDSKLNAITVRAGVHAVTGSKEPPNIAVHRLHLDASRWELIAEREKHRAFRIEPAELFSGEGQLEWLLPTRVPFTNLKAPLTPALEAETHLEIMGMRVVLDDPTYGIINVRIEGELPEEVVRTLIEDILSNFRRGSGVEWTAVEVDVTR